MNKKCASRTIALLCLLLMGLASFGGIQRSDAETRPVPVRPVTVSELPTEELAPSPEPESSPETPTPETPTATPGGATEEEAPATPTPPVTPSEEEREPEVIEEAPSNSSFCNGSFSGLYKTINGVDYVCAQGVIAAVDPAAHFRAADKSLSIEADGFVIELEKGLNYFLCNGRYLYASEGVRWEADGVYVPAESLARCFGGSVEKDAETGRLSIWAEEIVPLASGDEFYNETDLYWLSRVIYAESGTESLEGQIAVGNVVLNRVESSRFPKQNDIKSVIFAQSQFDVVSNGTIYLEPDEEAVIAACLALEGFEIVPGALFFAQFSLGSAYTTLAWIGAHCFMTLA